MRKLLVGSVSGFLLIAGGTTAWATYNGFGAQDLPEGNPLQNALRAEYGDKLSVGSDVYHRVFWGDRIYFSLVGGASCNQGVQDAFTDHPKLLNDLSCG
jgi:hypothetical protein